MRRFLLTLSCLLPLFGPASFAQTDSLSGRIYRLDAAVVAAGSKAERLAQPQTGLASLDAGVVRHVPALMGERDILKVIQMLPGVQSPSDGAAGFSVRGGQVDQNLILLDGTPIYCAGHVFGFISIFNDDVLGMTELYKGDFPARYGGRISSVLEANTRDGNLTRRGGNATIGLVSSKVHLEGPVVPDKLSYSVSARRSLIDLAFPFIRELPGGTTLRFFDINAKLSWLASGRDRLSLNAFSGGDKIAGALLQYGLRLSAFEYSNRTVSLKWRHDFSPSLQSNVALYYSRYRFGLHANYNYAIFDYSSFVRETGLRADLSWQIGLHNTLEAGLQLPFHYINSGDCVPGSGNITMTEMHIPPSRAIQPNLHLENTTTLDRATFR
ncbi:MAG: TonB-dependent receptor plug domain-containing protein, partial [Bacteroidales bacterium]|nr:TonB-dependent receptor plug domain-containing protein [Bacteroidales bacterium]